MDDVKFMTGYNVEPVVASESALEDAIEKYYGSTRPLELGRGGGSAAALGGPGAGGPTLKGLTQGSALSLDDMAAIGGLSDIDLDSIAGDDDVGRARAADDEIDLGNLARNADAAPVIKLTDVLLVDSLKRGASDIHVEPYEEEFRVRFRIDGVLYNVMALPMKLRDPLIARIKVLAKLDVAERRLPQDGRIRVRMRVENRSRDLDFRVSVRPTQWGEKIVLRLLDKSRLILDMSRLGFEPCSLDRFRGGLGRARGLVLVSGPRGSGKTTTLYSALAGLNKPDANLVTVEDPVEFDLPGVNQISINRAAGENPAVVLRSLQHVDADVILLSEIGDADTATVAFDLAQQGLVLSTLPADDAVSVILRLSSMGIDPYLLATTASVIVSQRLVRRICAKCKVDVTADVPSKALVEMGFASDVVRDVAVMAGRGCAACNGTGYKGRVGLYEVMEIDEELKELVLVGASSLELRRKAIERGMISLRQSGIRKIKAGLTTIEEVVRETVH
jgi:type IV pilus assembly protein PilB